MYPPPKCTHPPEFRTGFIKLHIILISSFNPGGVHLGGGGLYCNS